VRKILQLPKHKTAVKNQANSHTEPNGSPEQIEGVPVVGKVYKAPGRKPKGQKNRSDNKNDMESLQRHISVSELSRAAGAMVVPVGPTRHFVPRPDNKIHETGE